MAMVTAMAMAMDMGLVTVITLKINDQGLKLLL